MGNTTSPSRSSNTLTSADSDEYDDTISALSEDFRTESLESRLRRVMFSSFFNVLQRLMEWFVEAMIGVDLIRNKHPSVPPLIIDNIRIDRSSTIWIAFPSSPHQPSISGTLSSDISTLCQFFLQTHRTLQQQYRLILPLDPEQKDIVFANIMVALIEHFVASGDLHLPNSSPQDCSKHFVQYYHQDDVENSEYLLDAIQEVRKTHSLDAVWHAFYDWKEWVTMLEMVEQNMTDLSFLQSPCLRATLEALQSKHQIRANPPQHEESIQTNTPPDQTTTDSSPLPHQAEHQIRATPPPIDENGRDELSINRLLVGTSIPFRFGSSEHTSTDSSDISSSAISTQTSLPSQQSSSDSPTLASEPLIYQTKTIPHHSQLLLSEIHLHLGRPSPPSFLWNIRGPRTSEAELDALLQPTRQVVDGNKRFDVSLFDEKDDHKLVASLRRCYAIVAATNSKDCILDYKSFRRKLLSALHSPNAAVGIESIGLFFKIGECLREPDDPRGTEFMSLRTAFIDGTFWEKMALLTLWVRWLDFRVMNGKALTMTETDFDFGGLLAADLSDTRLFDRACMFVLRIVLFDALSMSHQWRMDFLVQFEKNHGMMSRLTCVPSPSSRHNQSEHLLSPRATILGSFLSLTRGFDFASALTELITIDLESSPHTFSDWMNPATLLLSDGSDVRTSTVCTSTKFLHIPVVRLHSLLLRSPQLNLNQNTLWNLLLMIFKSPDPLATLPIILNLFRFYPPPRLFDTLLCLPPPSTNPPSSTASLIRATQDIWHTFFMFFPKFGGFVTPFGACSSLAKVFQLLVPFDSIPDAFDLAMLSETGEKVVSLHWLNIPSHFDSPLLCHLPSLAGAQRGVLQTLSSHSGIPSLVAPLTTCSINDQLSHARSHTEPTDYLLAVLSLHSRFIAAKGYDYATRSPDIDIVLNAVLTSPCPAVASTSCELCLRFVSVASDVVRMESVKCGLLDSVMFAVSCSSFLDDYEKGVAVIGILLNTIRLDSQKQQIRQFGFFFLSSDNSAAMRKLKDDHHSF
ncbi:hypothetical protein BLNAU_9995 [Blattamonas nauphoetae]|uniref:Uncharacterized protein n=1 Tax=Blattamonas nauphoetae TaxID=2049346 RepID=A0ABQ9XUB3_9EUKA|nr:hypothetical protein BLNAU_9995 [Blattamonas nauphoetae]